LLVVVLQNLYLFNIYDYKTALITALLKHLYEM